MNILIPMKRFCNLALSQWYRRSRILLLYLSLSSMPLSSLERLTPHLTVCCVKRFTNMKFNVFSADDQIKITVRTAGWMNNENLNLNWIKFEFVKLSSGTNGVSIQLHLIPAFRRQHPFSLSVAAFALQLILNKKEIIICQDVRSNVCSARTKFNKKRLLARNHRT